MIAVDTSSLRRYLEGAAGRDVDLVEMTIEQRQMVIPPPVLTEIVSDPDLPAAALEAFAEIPLIELLDGYWYRAGLLRARLLSSGRKAKVADALIAQACVDHDIPLITNDRDFRHYEAFGLSLL